MDLITDTAALAGFCERQRGGEFVAIDTEFMRERTYWPILCVVQVAGPEEAVAIDALAPEIDLAPLLALMSDAAILKVFHAARQDLEIFFQLRGRVERRFLGVVRALASWREEAAQTRDLPRGRIMRDEAVLEIAAHAPKTIEGLARTRSLGKGVAEGKLGQDILDAVAAGLADPEPPPAIAQKAESPPGIGPLI